jgi:conjugal transfer pilus assembly protein TraL
MTTPIPQTIDDLPKVLFWDMDQAMVFVLLFGIGIAMSQAMTFSIVGFGLAWVFGQFKSGKHRGYARHLLYWHTPSSLGMKRTPPSAIREFLG